jgi:hypothetical protein
MRYLITIAAVILAGCGNGPAQRLSDEDPLTKLADIEYSISMAEGDSARSARTQDSLLLEHARRAMDSMNVANGWHFPKRTVDSLANVLEAVAFVRGDTSRMAQLYFEAVDSAYSAHLRAELARRDKNRFMAQ